MKYYSEKLNKLFDNKQDLFIAEKDYETKLAKEKAEFKEKEAKLKAQVEEDAKTISKRKKELSDKIEEASRNLDEVYKFYEAEKSKAKDILTNVEKQIKRLREDANDEINRLMEFAEAEVKKASEQKTIAISNFNKELGTYKTVITGDKAIEEYNKMVRNMDNTFSKFFNDFFTWRF